MTYRIEVYEDAWEEPTDSFTIDDALLAFMSVLAEAMNLPNETGRFNFGDAGDDELFEMFPRVGRGTVVLSID